MINDKIQVINPIQFFTTVSEEIEEIISSNDVPMDVFLTQMNWQESDLKNLRKINKAQANQIEKIVQNEGISSYLLNFQINYKANESKANEMHKKHLKIFKRISHILPLLRNEFTSGSDTLEDISDFLGIENESEILDRVHDNIALYRISGFTPDSLNLYAWLKRGELDFYQRSLPEYNKTEFLNWINSYEWKNHLYSYDYINSLPGQLEKFGIALVYTQHLEKTVFGAVRWFEGRPLVQVSDKGKCMATFWYTLFHEFGHVIKHENDEIFEGTLDLPQSKITQKEKEANLFAYSYLFNGDNLRRYIFGHRGQFVPENFIHETSRNFKVDKMFTAYWMKKALIKSKTINESIPTLQFG